MHLLAVADSCWQLLAVVGIYWQLQLLAVAGSLLMYWFWYTIANEVMELDRE